MHVKFAFLNGTLEKEVYLRQPQGFVVKGHEHQVCKLRKTLYGLRQSPRAWNTDLDQVLRDLGLVSGHAEPGLYVFEENSLILILLVYVDDLMITGNHVAKLEAIQQHLCK